MNQIAIPELILELPYRYGGFTKVEIVSSQKVTISPIYENEEAVGNLRIAMLARKHLRSILYRDEKRLASGFGTVENVTDLSEVEKGRHLTKLQILQGHLRSVLGDIFDERPRYNCMELNLRLRLCNENGHEGKIVDISRGGMQARFFYEGKEFLHQHLKAQVRRVTTTSRMINGILISTGKQKGGLCLDALRAQGSLRIARVTEPDEEGHFYVRLEDLASNRHVASGKILVMTGVHAELFNISISEGLQKIVNALESAGRYPLPRKQADKQHAKRPRN